MTLKPLQCSFSSDIRENAGIICVHLNCCLESTMICISTVSFFPVQEAGVSSLGADRGRMAVGVNWGLFRRGGATLQSYLSVAGLRPPSARKPAQSTDRRRPVARPNAVGAADPPGGAPPCAAGGCAHGGYGCGGRRESR